MHGLPWWSTLNYAEMSMKLYTLQDSNINPKSLENKYFHTMEVLFKSLQGHEKQHMLVEDMKYFQNVWTKFEINSSPQSCKNVPLTKKLIFLVEFPEYIWQQHNIQTQCYKADLQMYMHRTAPKHLWQRDTGGIAISTLYNDFTELFHSEKTTAMIINDHKRNKTAHESLKHSIWSVKYRVPTTGKGMIQRSLLREERSLWMRRSSSQWNLTLSLMAGPIFCKQNETNGFCEKK